MVAIGCMIGAGILLSGNEVSQIMLSLVMTYFGGHGHRPRLAAFGIIFSGIASLLIVVPHFVYGQFAPATNGKHITLALDKLLRTGLWVKVFSFGY